MNKPREKRTLMNSLQERIYMLLQQTMNQPKSDQVTCQWRKKLSEQVEARGNEKSYHAQIKPTESRHAAVEFNR